MSNGTAWGARFSAVVSPILSVLGLLLALLAWPGIQATAALIVRWNARQLDLVERNPALSATMWGLAVRGQVTIVPGRASGAACFSSAPHRACSHCLDDIDGHSAGYPPLSHDQPGKDPHPYRRRSAEPSLHFFGTAAGSWTAAGPHRAEHETRTIPIPPDLVKLLRAHIKSYGTTPDGRIFQTAPGGIIQDSAYGIVWAEARQAALTPAQYRSPLAAARMTCGTRPCRCG